MKKLITWFLLAAMFMMLFFVSPAAAQISIPAAKPVVCSGPANNCFFVVANGYTAIVVARQAGGLPITVTIGYGTGQTLQSDYEVPFTGDSIYHISFTSLPYPSGVQFTFAAGAGTNVFLLLYEGNWAYSKGAEGDYAKSNDAFPDCVNGQNCPYWWTQPIVPEKGNLLISFADSNATGCGVFRPGPGWAIEATSCIFAVEDKIAAVEAPEIGSMYASSANGSDSGGSHWLMGLVSYKRVP